MSDKYLTPEAYVRRLAKMSPRARTIIATPKLVRYWWRLQCLFRGHAAPLPDFAGTHCSHCGWRR